MSHVGALNVEGPLSDLARNFENLQSIARLHQPCGGWQLWRERR